MCGIVGLFNYGGAPGNVQQDILQRMTDEIRHRGPDDDGTWISPNGRAALGFRRLSIVDLSMAGHQPMSTPDGRITMVFNGEIYNHATIRKELEDLGYTYRSRTDTETILYAYDAWGIDCVKRFYGMFAIAILDNESDELHLVRDRIGIKPLYYTISDGLLAFASEIKALLKHPRISAVLNRQGLYDYLTLLTTPPNESLFAGIYKLEAGHILTIDRSGDVRQRQFWEMNEQSEQHSARDMEREEYVVENIRRLLRDSIRLRMMADVPFGVLLSGGIDSSLNVALMSELMERPVETFSVGYRELEKYNELGYARQISDQFATNHHEMFLEEDQLVDFLPKMVWHLDEPNADPVCVPMYFVSKLARDTGTIVVQVGEGSDEQFSGYAHYLRELKFHKYYHRMLPGFSRQIAYRLLKWRNPDSLLTEYARRSAIGDAIFYGGAISFSEESKRLLLDPEFANGSQITGRIAERFTNINRGLLSPPDNQDYLRQMIYFEFKSRLAELLLMRVDKMSMATSVEARVPFLDHRLVEFSYRIPSAMKVKNGEPKYILKKAAEGILPDNIIYRRKQGFAAPVREWLRSGRLARHARETIMDSKMMSDGIFDAHYVASLIERHASGSANFSNQIWSLLVLAHWFEIYRPA